MDLTTRCPRCGTVFEAGLQELQLRKGYIRCVQCAHIFDGYAAVVSDAAHTTPDVPKPHVQTPAEPAFIDHAVPDDVPPSVFRPARQEPRFTIGDRDPPAASPPDPEYSDTRTGAGEGKRGV